MLTTTDLLAAPEYEKQTIQTPLGIRFWDSARDEQVVGPLRVSARPVGQPGAVPVRAFTTLSGIYAFSGLPGLRSWERPMPGTPTPAFPTGAAGVIQYWIDVVDPTGDFNPVTFVAPAPTQGLYPGGQPGFLMFSSPSRSTLPGVAAIRADLVDAATNGPASFAVVQAQIAGQSAVVGVADVMGRVVVMFPFPTMSRTLTPPVTPPATPAPAATWPLTISVLYEPSTQKPVPSVPLSNFSTSGAGQPELGSILAQAGGRMIPPAGGAAVSSLAVTLTAGADIVLQSQNRSELVVQSA